MIKFWKNMHSKGSHARTSARSGNPFKELGERVKQAILTQDTDVLFLKYCAVLLVILAVVVVNFDDAEEPEYAKEEHTPGYMQVDFAYEATAYPWQELGYDNIISYRAALDEAVENSEGVAEEAIGVYAAVISEEQAEQLRDYESHMLEAVTFTTYNKYLDLFNAVCLDCEEELGAITAAQAAEYKSGGGYSGGSYSGGYWDFMRDGVVYHNGSKFTYYSQSVLPGGGLNIPGRHVEDGFVKDADGYIVIASDKGYGAVIDTPFGAGKSYDTGVSGDHYDIYVE